MQNHTQATKKSALSVPSILFLSDPARSMRPFLLTFKVLQLPDDIPSEINRASLNTWHQCSYYITGATVFRARAYNKWSIFDNDGKNRWQISQKRAEIIAKYENNNKSNFTLRQMNYFHSFYNNYTFFTKPVFTHYI